MAINLAFLFLLRQTSERQRMRKQILKMEASEKEVDTIVWYYAEGKSKNEYTKKETVSISLRPATLLR